MSIISMKQTCPGGLKNTVYCLSAVIWLASCSTQVPIAIREDLVNTPAIQQVRDQPDTYIGQQVRWGGILLNTQTLAESTRLTILSYPLGSNGKPRGESANNNQHLGRFIAIIPGFLEPSIYAKNRMITVRGQLITAETHKIDEYDYVYPVVKSSIHYIWPIVRDTYHDPYPIFLRYDPWYYPYHYPYPYRRHPHKR